LGCVEFTQQAVVQMTLHPVDLPQSRTRGRLSNARRFVEGLGPYQSLTLLLVPTAIVEPLKLVAVAVAGAGHWITGTAMIVIAYAASLLLVERLFAIVKPKLLTLPWFARLWGWFVNCRGRFFTLFAKSTS
jgi:hypothetical protein